jgi:hypothetical protein
MLSLKGGKDEAEKPQSTGRSSDFLMPRSTPQSATCAPFEIVQSHCLMPLSVTGRSGNFVAETALQCTTAVDVFDYVNTYRRLMDLRISTMCC